MNHPTFVSVMFGSALLACGGGTVSEVPRSELPDRVSRLVDALEPAWVGCPDRVWLSAGKHYRQSQVLFVSQTDGHAFLWNDQSAGPQHPPRITALETASLDVAWRAASFNTGVFQGAPTLAVNLEQTEARVVVLALHEGFHSLSGQHDWLFTREGSRDTPYPEAWRPWYDRSQLERTLRGVSQEDGRATLEAAGYWLWRFAGDAPERRKALRTTDVLEGSAQYATVLGLALADVGCSADDDALHAAALRVNEALSVTELSYPLGVEAGLALQRQHTPGWQSAIERGTPPAEVLLSDVTPQLQPDDPATVAQAQRDVAARNAEAAEEVTPLLDRTQSPDFSRLVLAQQWVAGGVTLSAMYRLTDTPGRPRLLKHVSATFVVPRHARALQVDQYSVLQGVPTPCGAPPDETFTVAIPRSAVTMTADGATSSFANVTFDRLAVTERVDALGLAWLCPE